MPYLTLLFQVNLFLSVLILECFGKNHNNGSKKEKVSNGATFRVGDRVMQIKNNYDIYWEKDSIKQEQGSGVFNGETGTIINVSDIEKSVEVKFDDEKICLYEFSELEQIEHSYSITIHKAQRKRV